MSRANKRDTAIRASLETIGAELAVIRKVVPVTKLRVEQARVRTGLHALLRPAADELDVVADSLAQIGDAVSASLKQLSSK
jgi:hypothetical protein